MRSLLDSTAIDFIGRTRYYVADPGARMQKIVIILGIAGLLAAGCAATPSKRVTGYSASAGDKAADTALVMVGRPYRFKGETPGGFDCSGLVRYSYLTAGMDVPHGTTALRNNTRSVGLRNARKGDLLFFDQEGRKYSHVGIYVGNDQFVHAPSTGGFVRRESITDAYWNKHYLDTRRFF